MEDDNQTTTTNSAGGHAKRLNKLLAKDVGGGKSAWSMTLETIGLSDGGKDMPDDVAVETLEEAMEQLKLLLQSQESNDVEVSTLLDCFGATREDLLRAFCCWSLKFSSSYQQEVYQVSKAYRRYQSYQEWMKKNWIVQDSNDPPQLNVTKIQQLKDVWKIRASHDQEGRLIVWACEFDSMDMKYIKNNVPHHDTLLYCVWLCHLILLDEGAQTQGTVVVASVGRKTGMMEFFTLIPMEMQTTFDRLFMGTLPVRVQSFILFDNPTWIRILLALIGPFLSRKMKKRMVNVGSKQDPQEVIEQMVGGKSSIPKCIGCLEGELEKDLVGSAIQRLKGREE